MQSLCWPSLGIALQATGSISVTTEETKSNIGLIIGAVVGGVLAVVLLGVLVAIILQNDSKQRSRQMNNPIITMGASPPLPLPLASRWGAGNITGICAQGAVLLTEANRLTGGRL